MASTTKPHRKILLAPLLLLGLIGLAFWQRQYIYDQVRLYNYEPSAEVSQIADDTAMTNGSRKVFYVNRPELVDRQSFSSFCESHNEQTAVLGCYKGPQRGIYLLSVDNPELTGIEEVTAAHEMLHAEYDRLSSSERNRINRLLNDFYNTKLQDEATKKTIDSYRDSAPDDLINEMHSIIGTQVSALTPELEKYYGQYFTDRARVIALYQRYEQAFSSRQKQVEEYDRQLRVQKDALDSLESSVERQADSLRSQQARLERLRASNDVNTYNTLVDTYNADARTYNAAVRSLRTSIDTYNALVEKRNEISFEEQKLIEDISAPSVPQQ